MESKKNPGPMFIVGASRSGTAMIRSIVGKHPEVSFPGETHYFDDLRPRMAGKHLSGLDEADRRICEDYFLALAHRPYGHQGNPELSSISREDLRAYAEQLGSGTDSYFEAFCRIHAEREGATVWGDKTPRHVYRIPDILSRYSDAKVIAMLRDPRGVVASYRDWTNQGGFDLEADPDHVAALAEEKERVRASYHPVVAALLWRATVQAAVTAQRRFGEARVRIQQYEALIREPAASTRAICEWLDLGFFEEMLDIPVLNSSFSSFDQAGGISTAPMDRWREKLDRNEIAVVQQVAGRLMRETGYELEPVSFSPGQILPWLSVPIAFSRAFRANLDRMGGGSARYVWRRIGLARRRSR